jgi:hypothetical protein
MGTGTHVVFLHVNIPAGASSGVGSYAITGSGISSASSNYTIATQQASGNAAALTIAARPLMGDG